MVAFLPFCQVFLVVCVCGAYLGGLDKVDIYYCDRGKKTFFLSKKHISHIANYTICCIFVAIVNLVTLLYQDI